MADEPMTATGDLFGIGPGDFVSTLSLLDCVDQAILVLADDHRVSYANYAALQLLTDVGATSALDHLDATSYISPVDLERAISQLDEQGSSTIRIRPPSGEHELEMSLTDHRSTPGIDGLVACFRGLERERLLDQRLEHHRRQAEHLLSALTDELTGLATRRLFLDRLGQRLRSRPTNHPLSVFLIGLDRFKAINDALGPTAGDSMLRSTAERLQGTVPGVEQWGRVGGDEFVVFIEQCGYERAEAIADSIAASLRQSIVLGGRTLHSSASIGLRVVDTDNDAATVLRRAEIAMSKGKRTGPDTVTVFTPAMEHHVVIRAELEGQLRSTLTGGGPDVVFQPIVDLQSGRTIAVEALARWHSPTQGPIGPDRFVAIAESIDLVRQLDRHVLRKGSRAIVDRCEPSSGWPLDLSVNGSTTSLSHPDDADRILQIIDDEGFAPQRLILEVTESMAIENDGMLRRQLEILRERGVRIAIDDFGTGHSSLAQLETLPVDFVKMDRTFLAGIPASRRRMRYLESIIAMADALRLEVIFEGIEDRAQAHVLAELGVELGQGYLMAEPIGATELEARMVSARQIVLDTTGDTAHWQPVLEWVNDRT